MRTENLRLYQLMRKSAVNFFYCVKLTRSDGKVFRFASSQSTILAEEPDNTVQEYLPANFLDLEAFESQLGLSLNNTTFKATITHDTITDDDIISKKYVNAKVDFFIAFTAAKDIYQLHQINVSWIGEVREVDEIFEADVRGITFALTRKFVDRTSLNCRFAFESPECGFNASVFGIEGTVTQVIAPNVFTISNNLAPTSQIYKYGKCTFRSGANEGQPTLEILYHLGKTITLFLPPNYDVGEGDEVLINLGCNKSFAACIGYNNFLRFGGEPYLATDDLLQEYPT